jgi:lactate racemase
MDKLLRLPYGDSYIEIGLPLKNLSYVLQSKLVPGKKDEHAAIQEALRNPLGSSSLVDRLQKNSKVVVITTDNTRHCPDDRIVPVILEELEQKIPRQNITVVVALGLHSPLSREQLVQKLGRKIIDSYRVINHNPDDTIFLGTTSAGTPVEIFSEVVRADFRISTGFVEPHFFAGFSGGRKSIAPGVSSAKAIRHNHSYKMIDHPNSRAGVLNGNPIHEDMVEQAKMAKLDFIVNVLLNSEHQITHVFCGDPWLAHTAACQEESNVVEVELDHKVDITIVTNGGAPLDLDFYQTCKGIDTASQITRNGGIIIVVSSCSSGVGPEAFCQLHSSAYTPQDVIETIRQSGQSGVGWQNQVLARAQLNHSIYLLSNLPDNLVQPLMATPIHTIAEGLDKAIAALGKDAEIAIVPEGPLVLPVVKHTD